MSGVFSALNIKATENGLKSLCGKYKTELLVFLSVFVIVFSSTKMYSTAVSNGNVEQWVNLTNQIFYEGRDFLFSYGPLYWLVGGSSTQYNIYAYWGSITYISVMYAIFWALIFSLVHKARSYLYLAVAFFLFFSGLAFPAAFYLLPFATVAYLEFSRDKPVVVGVWGMAVLGAVVGFLFYVRFFYGLVGVATIGSYFFIRLFNERKISRLICFVAAVALSYIAVGLIIFHNVASIVNYLVINKNLSFGNSVDMTLESANSPNTFVAVFLVVAALNVYLVVKRRSLLLTLNVLLLLLFKLGFSRTDHYLGYFVIPTAALALAMVFDKSRLGRAMFVIALAGLYYLSINPSYPGAPTKDALVSGVDFNSDYSTRMKSLYADYRLDNALLSKIKKSTIDVYPYNNEYMFANDLNYSHRPSFQNYMTLTPVLDLMNKSFFESAARPKFVLWSAGIACVSENCNVFDAFDRKYSLNEDPLTVGAILLNYHVVEVSKGKGGVPLILLEANSVKADAAEQLLTETVMKFDEWYKVPKHSGNVVKIIPDFELTAYARLKNLLFRGDILKIRYKLVSGDIREYRLNILNSKSGVWVSPLIDNFEFSGEAVESIMFSSESSHYFKPEFSARWVASQVPNVHNKPIAFNRSTTAISGVRKNAVVACEGSIDLMNGAGATATTLHATDRLKLQGWLASSTKSGTLFDATYLTLTDEKGGRFFIETNRETRADVGAAYQKPALNVSGFNGLLDLSTLRGRYKLGLGGVQGAEFSSCSQFEIPVTIEP
ncbi:hypothetical protein [Pseudomonas sp. BW7P1]|uniref:hypothetical protein n=1 Tax=Pseudomonas TaxID=286 RepID=UPI0021ADEAF7|nr:hypothetical protein [Pseudomonas sp. BW7P1]UWI60392.1 hypothetical protein NWV16_20090 [Pseudomonas sp. BW7P1]